MIHVARLPRKRRTLASFSSRSSSYELGDRLRAEAGPEPVGEVGGHPGEAGKKQEFGRGCLAGPSRRGEENDELVPAGETAFIPPPSLGGPSAVRNPLLRKVATDRECREPGGTGSSRRTPLGGPARRSRGPCRLAERLWPGGEFREEAVGRVGVDQAVEQQSGKRDKEFLGDVLFSCRLQERSRSWTTSCSSCSGSYGWKAGRSLNAGELIFFDKARRRLPARRGG